MAIVEGPSPQTREGRSARRTQGRRSLVVDAAARREPGGTAVRVGGGGGNSASFLCLAVRRSLGARHVASTVSSSFM